MHTSCVRFHFGVHVNRLDLPHSLCSGACQARLTHCSSRDSEARQAQFTANIYIENDLVQSCPISHNLNGLFFAYELHNGNVCSNSNELHITLNLFKLDFWTVLLRMLHRNRPAFLLLLYFYASSVLLSQPCTSVKCGYMHFLTTI